MRFKTGDWVYFLGPNGENRGGGGWASLEIGKRYQIVQSGNSAQKTIVVDTGRPHGWWYANKECFTKQPPSPKLTLKQLKKYKRKELFGI